ncbi:glutathione S-transferase theta-2B-like [Suncus etruscus]|uniref:glutathione S-transferase theta-2B-like n=1 Tax=Suncus etruscus TaxID=109475 RepID=UPI002110C4EE|nr:glutathione S-transferase theta-2B-like [Suncus etruscus]
MVRAPLLFLQVIAPVCGLQIPEEKVERNKDLMDKTLHKMEEYFLGNKPFLAGQEMTIADLMALEELMQPLGVGYDLLGRHKKLEAWRNRVETFLGSDLVKEAHHPIMNIVQISASTTIPPPPPDFYSYLRHRIARIP